MDNSCFYYGVQTAEGACSGMFNQENLNIFAIGGGSPKLKEKIFIRISDELNKNNFENELLLSYENCFGIFCKEKNFLIADEKFLNKNEEKKAKKFFDINQFYSEKIPQNILHIYTDEQQEKLERCNRFLSAANCLKKDLARIDSESVNVRKVIKFTSRFWEKYGWEMIGRVGTETKKFVSCITPDGVELNMKAFDECDRLAVIVDKTGAAATLAIDRIRRYALSSGFDVVSCVCSLDGETVEHIIVPELNFAVFSSEYYHRILPKKERRIFAARFHSKDRELVQNRINFTLKAYRSLMNEAFDSLLDAQEIEKKYNSFFDEITDVTDFVNEVIKSAI